MNGENRNIEAIEPCGKGTSICFTIGHRSHQFITQDFIVVHDTTGTPSCRKLVTKENTGG